MTAPIIVIGAGIGGLAAAIRLAAAGEPVLVLEKNPAVGGKMSEWREVGFRWDTGPSVITMRHVLEELFASSGRRLDEYLSLLPVDPLTRYFYPDGTRLDATANLSRMLPQIADLDERDVAGYLRFLAYAAELHRITGPLFIYGRSPGWRAFTRVTPRDALAVRPWRTMQGVIEQSVRSPALRQLLGRFATYVGASPFRAPATLSVIAHVEMAAGVWYPRGGVYAIARALRRLAEELGVEIRTRTPVQAITLEDGRANGVLVGDSAEDGEMLAARAVISNVDALTTLDRLLPGDGPTRRRLERLRGGEPSGSGFVLLWGVRGEHRELAHHNIFFSGDYRREFAQLVGEGVPADEPTLYVAITARSDPDHAPPGSENWFVMANAPPLGTVDWERAAPAYRDRVVARLARFGLDVRDRIAVERILTPSDLAEHSGAHRGALYGISMNSPLAPWRRPANQLPEAPGLFLAGGSTHPGGGVPMVMLSGKLAAGLALDYVHRGRSND